MQSRKTFYPNQGPQPPNNELFDKKIEARLSVLQPLRIGELADFADDSKGPTADLTIIIHLARTFRIRWHHHIEGFPTSGTLNSFSGIHVGQNVVRNGLRHHIPLNFTNLWKRVVCVAEFHFRPLQPTGKINIKQTMKNTTYTTLAAITGLALISCEKKSEQVIEDAKDSMEESSEMAKDKMDEAKDKMEEAKDEMMEKADGMNKKMDDTAAKASEKMDDTAAKASEMMDDTADKAADMMDKAEEEAKGMVDGMKDKTEEVMDDMNAKKDEMVDDMKKMKDEAVEGGSDAVEDAKKKAADMMRDAAEKVEGAE